MPTLASVASTSIPDAIMDGRNMISVLNGDTDTIREEMFWEWHGQRAARIGNYKWVDIDGETGGLFDLSQDKEEQIDLSEDRKSTRLNSSHVAISYAVFCLKKKNTSEMILIKDINPAIREVMVG